MVVGGSMAVRGGIPVGGGIEVEDAVGRGTLVAVCAGIAREEGPDAHGARVVFCGSPGRLVTEWGSVPSLEAMIARWREDDDE